MEVQILKTKDYTIFKEVASNREVDQKHVNKLIKAIENKNLLSVNPILVNKDMYIIDGQHRLSAAKYLNTEIYYIIGEVSRKDISKLNSFQKNWSAMDYINFYTIEKSPQFLQLSHLINKYSNMSVSALLTLSNSEGRRDLVQLKEGYLDVLNIDHAVQVCDLCALLNKEFDYTFVWDSRFPLAIGKCLGAENFKAETLIEKITNNPRSFVKCHTVKQYLAMIQDVYNYMLSKNKISIEK
jgi:hypothetical protein